MKKTSLPTNQSQWINDSTYYVAENTTLQSLDSNNIKRIKVIIEEGCTLSISPSVKSFANETEIEVDGELKINSDVTFGAKTLLTINSTGKLSITSSHTTTFNLCSIIDSRKGQIEIENGATINLKENTLLQLSNHPIRGNGNLHGLFARIDAPIVQIFCDDITVDGDWSVDRAYPQWFATIDTNKGNMPADYDWAKPINKAIDFKRTGEVFLPRGLYTICSTIFVKDGICLMGTGNRPDGLLDNEGNRDNANIGTQNYCTVIQAVYEEKQKEDNAVLEINEEGSEWTPLSQFHHGYMIMVNADEGSYPVKDKEEAATDNDNTRKEENEADDNNERGKNEPKWRYLYPAQGTAIKNICISNYYRYIELYNNSGAETTTSANLHTGIKGLKGIFFSGCVEISGVIFRALYQSIVSDLSAYADLKKITGCWFYPNDSWTTEDYTANEEVFACDLSGLGDALVFTHNEFGASNYCKDLKLKNCSGGTIASNVFTRVTIEACRSILFTSNHMERTSSLEINQSQMEVCNNFFELGTRPAVIIKDTAGVYDMSVVSLHDNAYMFYDGLRLIDNQDDLKSRLENITEFDIAIGNYTELSIRNEFRYRAMLDFGISSHPFAVSIGYYTNLNDESSICPVIDFEKYNHILSHSCSIKANLNVDKVAESDYPCTIEYLGSDYNVGQAIAKSLWAIDNGYYKYSYRIIVNGEAGEETAVTDSDGNEQVFSLKEITYQEKPAKAGTLLRLYSPQKGCAKIRLYRYKLKPQKITTNGKIEISYTTVERRYADIPSASAKELHDNGVSVCGYKWKLDTVKDDINLNSK